MDRYFVYILLCSDNSYYTGVTNSIEKRMTEHESGEDISCYTYKWRPLNLVFHQSFTDVNQAIAIEKRIKGWRRAKKEAIINGQWDLLPRLAQTTKK